MKYVIDGVLVVEGKADVSFLSSFIDTYFFVTDGYDFNCKKSDLLNRISLVKKVIIFTDPDEAGEQIRKSILSSNNKVFDIKINKNTRKKYKKSGIAESEKDEIVKALTPFFTSSSLLRNDYKTNLLSSYKNWNKIKTKIIDSFHLINGNCKSIENQLNMLCVSPKEIDKIVMEFENDN